MPSNMLSLVRFFVGVVLVLGVFQLLILPTLHEGFRQKIFFLRRQLFMLVAHGKLSPQDLAYTRLRSTMNGLLRFAERLSLGRLFLHGVIFRPETKNYVETMDLRLAEIRDDLTKKELIAIREKVGYIIIWHVFFTSPLLWLVGVVFLPVLVPVSIGWALLKGVQELANINMRTAGFLYRYLPIYGVQAQAEALVMV